MYRGNLDFFGVDVQLDGGSPEKQARGRVVSRAYRSRSCRVKLQPRGRFEGPDPNHVGGLWSNEGTDLGPVIFVVQPLRLAGNVFPANFTILRLAGVVLDDLESVVIAVIVVYPEDPSLAGETE